MEGYLKNLAGQQTSLGEDHTKVQLVIDNYDSFLEAKIVLDNLNKKFVEADSTKQHL